MVLAVVHLILQKLKIVPLNPFFFFLLSSQHFVSVPEAADPVSKLKILWVAGSSGLWSMKVQAENAAFSS